MKLKRRQFITTSSAAIAAGFFTNCGKAALPELKVYTWADYIDPELVAKFEQEQSCRLLIDTFDSNESMHSKLSAGASGYDVLMPTSYMVKTMVREGMLQPLDHSKLPNLKHVDASYLQRALDPGMKHSVPYMMAPTCMAWLSSKVSNPESSYRMFDRADLKGRVTLLDDMREVLGAALRSLGFSLNSKDPAQMQAHAGSFDFILNTVAAPHVLDAYTVLLKRDGTLCLVGAPASPHPSPAVFNLIFGRKAIAGSLIGGLPETQEMLDFCAEHGIVADIEMIRADDIESAYERMLRSDVKYRFVIDTASMG